MTKRLRKTWRHLPSWMKGFVVLAAIIGLGVGVALAIDTDNDGMSDDFEAFFGLNPFVNDAAQDPDGDTLNNLAEALLFSDPFKTDTDLDGFSDNSDSNPVSRASIPWGNPAFTRTNDVVYTWPDWMVAAYRVGGGWDTNLPAWHADVADTNPAGLNIEVDRALLTNDLRVRMELSASPEATLYLDLYDTNGVILATNIGDNLLSGIGTGAVRTFSIPLEAHSAAVGLWLRRGTGDVTVSSSLLYVDKDGDGLDASQEQQLGTSDASLDSDGDGFTDHEEVFIFGTDPASATSLPLGGISGQVSYSGVLPGLIHVQASQDASGSPYTAFTTLSTPGSYQIAAAPLRRTYYVKAWRDVDGDGVRDSWEPCGDSVPLSLYLSSSSTNGVNVVMSDPDSDGDGMSDAAERLLGLDPTVSNNYAYLPFCEGFETNAVQAGDISGQNGWKTLLINTFLVQTGTVYEGNQALRWHLDSTNVSPAVTHGFASPVVDRTWIDVQVQVEPLSVPELGFTNEIAAFYFNGGGYLVVLDGLTSGVPAWVVLTNAAPVELHSWARVTVGLDFKNQNWTVCLNGIALKTGLAFGHSASELHQFSAVGQSGAADSFHVTTNQPSGLSLDGDRLMDDWELEHFNNLDASETGDPDADGVNNLIEFQQGLNPVVADTDGDTLPDGWELTHGFNPLASSDGAGDADGDGLSNAAEYQYGTSLTLADTDSDGLPDGAEINTWHTNPNLVDSDGDSYRDGNEIQNGTDPLDAQSHPNSHWAQSALITLRAGTVSNQLAGVPVLVRLTPERIDYSHCAENGRDLLFTDNEGQSLDFEIEKWTPGGESIVWVRLPVVGGTNGMDCFRMHWNNPDATNAAHAAAVWGTNTLGVWHLAETNGPLMDSSAGTHAATNIGALCATGWAGNARQFRGSDSILVPPAAVASISNQVTISFWQYGATNQPRNEICFEGTSPVGRELNAHVPWGDGNVYWDAFGNYDRISKLASTNSYRNAWTHWTFTKDRLAGTMQIYCNGELLHSGTGKTRAYTPVTAFRFGSAANGTYGYTGLMDELRVESVAQSPEWIRFQYKLMRDKVLVYGDQQVSISTATSAVEPSQQGAFQVSRTSQATNFPLTVWVEVSGGTAIQGTDYTLPQSVTIPAGATSAYLWVTPLDDLWLEGPETLTVRVADGDYFVNPAPATATLTIQDNDEDTDSDTLCDFWELLNIGNLDTLGTTDSDGDGLNNNSEYLFGTNPLNTDTDNDGLPDGWEVLKGANPLVNDAAADPDKDGLTNLQEYANGSNPFAADTDADGMPDKWEVDNGFNPANAADAAMDADADGLTNLKEYQNQANPCLADTDADGLGDAAEVNTHHTKPYSADSDSDGLPDKWEVDNGTNPNVNDANADPDNDGFVNLNEYNAGTNPQIPDSDGDGIVDGEEALLAHTDPLTVDCGTNITVVTTINGASIAAKTGRWQPFGTAIDALDGRGSVEYVFTNTVPCVQRLVVEGTQANNRATHNTFKIQASVDGEYLGVNAMTARTNAASSMGFYTPWLTNGVHRVRLDWDNVYAGAILRINRLQLQTMGGPDANANDCPDWLDSRWTWGYALGTTNATSYVSPMCLEGKGLFLSGMKIASSATTNTFVPQPLEGRQWYANVPLCETGLTTMAVTFEQGALTSTPTVAWVPFNVLQGGSMVVRKGDQLKLAAIPAGATSGVSRINVGNVTSYWPLISGAVCHTFSSSGVYAISGVFSNEQGMASNALQVTVLGGGFPTNEPICWWTKTRGWNCPNLPSQAVVESNTVVATSKAYDLSGGGRRLNLLVNEGDGPHYIAARVSTNGPVLDSRRLAVTWLRSTVAGSFSRIGLLPDGTQITEDTMTTGAFPATGRIRINIWTSGTVFEDGSVILWVEPSELSEVGSFKYRALVDPNLRKVACHSITIYEGTEIVGSR